MNNDQLWMDSYGFVYSADGRTLLKGASVEGAYWIPEGVEEIEPEALIGCKIGTLHIPWTAHVHEYEQLVFSKGPEENEELMPAVYFWTKDYKNRDEETWAFEDEGEYRVDEYGRRGRLRMRESIVWMSMELGIVLMGIDCCLRAIISKARIIAFLMAW